MLFIDFLTRWGHVLFGITWIGLLYYFNFIQGAYFAEATAGAKSDASKKLAPRALWWFRWGAMGTFLTGVYLLFVADVVVMNEYIALGALMGTFMFLNVWLIIWPNQKIALGMTDGDASVAAPKALLASRTNTLFSAPMLYGMLAAKHGSISGMSTDLANTGFIIALVIVLVLEANAIIGKLGSIASVKGVIYSSLALTVILFGIVHYDSVFSF